MARTVSIERERLHRWLDNFTQRHAGLDAHLIDPYVEVVGGDGAVARVNIPFPPLDSDPADLAPTGTALLDRLVDHVRTDRPVGAVLVRKGGFAVGVFQGADLVSSKVGSSYVQGKTKAGGWSQQRYARRRGHQARQLYVRAADAAEAVIVPEAGTLQAIATGGDRTGIEAVLHSPELSGLRDLLITRVFPVPDPRLRVLKSFPEQFLAVQIALNDLA